MVDKWEMWYHAEWWLGTSLSAIAQLLRAAQKDRHWGGDGCFLVLVETASNDRNNAELDVFKRPPVTPEWELSRYCAFAWHLWHLLRWSGVDVCGL